MLELDNENECDERECEGVGGGGRNGKGLHLPNNVYVYRLDRRRCSYEVIRSSVVRAELFRRSASFSTRQRPTYRPPRTVRRELVRIVPTPDQRGEIGRGEERIGEIGRGIGEERRGEERREEGRNRFLGVWLTHVIRGHAATNSLSETERREENADRWVATSMCSTAACQDEPHDLHDSLSSDLLRTVSL